MTSKHLETALRRVYADVEEAIRGLPEPMQAEFLSGAFFAVTNAFNGEDGPGSEIQYETTAFRNGYAFACEHCFSEVKFPELNPIEYQIFLGSFRSFVYSTAMGFTVRGATDAIVAAAVARMAKGLRTSSRGAALHFASASVRAMEAGVVPDLSQRLTASNLLFAARFDK